jgi:hypothetical protein
MVLPEIPEHSQILVNPVTRVLEFPRGDPSEMHNTDRRHNMTRDALVLDATVEIDVVEQQRELLVEETANIFDGLPSEKAERGPGLLDFLHLKKPAITIEVVALKSPSEHEPIDGTAGSMVVS